VNWYRYVSKPQEAAGHWALTLCNWEGNRRSGMTRSSRAALRSSRETCGLEEKRGGRVRTAVVRVSLMVTGQLADWTYRGLVNLVKSRTGKLADAAASIRHYILLISLSTPSSTSRAQG